MASATAKVPSSMSATASPCGRRRGTSHRWSLARCAVGARELRTGSSGAGRQPENDRRIATMGRNVHPLQRDGLITAVTDKTDRRRKTLLLTDAGLARLTACYPRWNDAQAQFHAAFGPEPPAELRRLLHAVSTSDLE